MVRIKLFYEKDTEHAGLQTYRFSPIKILSLLLVGESRLIIHAWLSLSIHMHYILFRFIPDIKQLASHTDPDPAVI